jgi:hypothetical protein
VFPWGLEVANEDRLDVARAVIAAAIYAYTGWDDPNKIMAIADDAVRKRQTPDHRDAEGVTIADDAKIAVLPISVNVVARAVRPRLGSATFADQRERGGTSGSPATWQCN